MSSRSARGSRRPSSRDNLYNDSSTARPLGGDRRVADRLSSRGLPTGSGFASPLALAPRATDVAVRTGGDRARLGRSNRSRRRPTRSALIDVVGRSDGRSRSSGRRAEQPAGAAAQPTDIDRATDRAVARRRSPRDRSPIVTLRPKTESAATIERHRRAGSSTTALSTTPCPAAPLPAHRRPHAAGKLPAHRCGSGWRPARSQSRLRHPGCARPASNRSSSGSA